VSILPHEAKQILAGAILPFTEHGCLNWSRYQVGTFDCDVCNSWIWWTSLVMVL